MMGVFSIKMSYGKLMLTFLFLQETRNDSTIVSFWFIHLVAIAQGEKRNCTAPC